ncbi:hypothetical protein FACS1894122_14590 [Alphaproteobacteria bacterium]|nr:hypothetical protein FACS1894122_14590 [Alphaproteobacteria bacterium]
MKKRVLVPALLVCFSGVVVSAMFNVSDWGERLPEKSVEHLEELNGLPKKKLTRGTMLNLWKVENEYKVENGYSDYHLGVFREALVDLIGESREKYKDLLEEYGDSVDSLLDDVWPVVSLSSLTSPSSDSSSSSSSTSSSSSSQPSSLSKSKKVTFITGPTSSLNASTSSDSGDKGRETPPPALSPSGFYDPAAVGRDVAVALTQLSSNADSVSESEKSKTPPPSEAQRNVSLDDDLESLRKLFSTPMAIIKTRKGGLVSIHEHIENKLLFGGISPFLTPRVIAEDVDHLCKPKSAGSSSTTASVFSAYSTFEDRGKADEYTAALDRVKNSKYCVKKYKTICMFLHELFGDLIVDPSTQQPMLVDAYTAKSMEIDEIEDTDNLIVDPSTQQRMLADAYTAKSMEIDEIEDTDKKNDKKKDKKDSSCVIL